MRGRLLSGELSRHEGGNVGDRPLMKTTDPFIPTQRRKRRTHERIMTGDDPMQLAERKSFDIVEGTQRLRETIQDGKWAPPAVVGPEVRRIRCKHDDATFGGHLQRSEEHTSEL